MTSDVSRVRFGRFVARVLDDARGRGMTDKDIELATNVGASTFHRWRRGQYKEAPEFARVQAFCEGLGVPTSEAMTALGMNRQRDNAAPEPAMDPDVRIILRALADPSVSPEDKRVIREILKMLANQQRRRRRPEAS